MSEATLQQASLEGVYLWPLKVIDTPGGAVMHMLRQGSLLAPNCELGKAASKLEVGEVYFSEVLPGAIKAWKRHTKQTQYFAVPYGLLGLVLYDDRPASPTRGKLMTIKLGRKGLYALLRIPCGLWYGFTALSNEAALICNTPDIAHDPNEGEKLALDHPLAQAIPFDWHTAVWE